LHAEAHVSYTYIHTCRYGYRRYKYGIVAIISGPLGTLEPLCAAAAGRSGLFGQYVIATYKAHGPLRDTRGEYRLEWGIMYQQPPFMGDPRGPWDLKRRTERDNAS
jgi:hypothetical protein